MHVSNSNAAHAPTKTATPDQLRPTLQVDPRTTKVDVRTGGGLEGVPEPIDLDAFMRAWGSGDAEFDFNGDGFVDGTDLAEALSRQAQQAAGDPSLESGPAGSTNLVDPAATLSNQASAATTPEDPGAPADGAEAPGVVKAWGTDAPQGDLDGNGTVDGRDLALALGGGAAAAETADETDTAWGTDAPVGDLDGDGVVNGRDLAMYLGAVEDAADEQSAFGLKSLLAGWGDGNVGDLDGDGTINGRDLAMLLGGKPGGPTAGPTVGDDGAAPPDVPAALRDRLEAARLSEGPSPKELQRLREAFDRGVSGDDVPQKPDRSAIAQLEPTQRNAVSEIGKRVVSTLQELGVTKAPPSNVHEIVKSLSAKLNFDPESLIGKGIAESIAARYGSGSFFDKAG